MYFIPIIKCVKFNFDETVDFCFLRYLYNITIIICHIHRGMTFKHYVDMEVRSFIFKQNLNMIWKRKNHMF